ncbi:MAG TPA: protocatechuate 3,4-dioxygenase subunit alpha [Terracidiphilus sp.]|nr:protocatechuate 3,4-dioxygenase subunit alpha [Terracidiphilus sp.]
MTPPSTLVPSGSQTVGPFFTIGLNDLIERQSESGAPSNAIQLHGQVMDRDGAPVVDAMLEFWFADGSGRYPDGAPGTEDMPAGFRRAGTDENGHFEITLVKPGASPFGDGRVQAPHCVVLVFARGLLRHLMTRVYFAGEAANAADPVLEQVPADRRQTLMANPEESGDRSFRWNVVLQGTGETAFFAW